MAANIDGGMPRAPSAVLAAVAVLAAGCGDRESGPRGRGAPVAAPPPRKRRGSDRASSGARCRQGAAGCAAVTGRVLYVEGVDDDGDGDAHYVVAGGERDGARPDVVDVGRTLRPRRLPRPGELVSASGPVFTGSYGQRQIEATELHHQRG